MRDYDKHTIFIICLSFFVIYLIMMYYYKTKEKIFIFWNQGWDKAPYICKMCLKSWKKYNNQDYNIIALDNNNIATYLPDKRVINTINNIGRFKSWTQASDLLRINLLAYNGGFWVDATIMCTKPINEYKHLIQTKYKFWCPYDFDANIHSYNFLYCSKNNKIIKKVTDSMNKYFDSKPISTYKDMDHLYLGRYMYNAFDKMIDWNIIKKQQLSKSSNKKKLGYKMFANSKHLLLQPITNEMIHKINQQCFLKLTTRHNLNNFNGFEDGTVIYYLIRKYT